MGELWKAGYSFGDIVGESAPLQQAIHLARQAAEAGYPTVLVGESGTGKELFAHAIHRASARRDGPFVPINCGTLSGELALAELCGYEPGSFTGADRHTREGILDTARGGTLFLDELQDMPATPQSALLRFLETSKFVRVGGTQPIHSSVRVIAASNVPIDELERCGRVRSDLLYRLNCVTIEIPPLRERRTDIRPLAEKCLREELGYLGDIDEEVFAALTTCPYPWPGNARGLRNILLRALLGLSDHHLTAADLPAYLWTIPQGNGRGNGAAHDMPDEEAVAIKAVLEAAGDNVSEAARRLGIHRSTIYRKLGRDSKRA